jgi:hypothetical protein
MQAYVGWWIRAAVLVGGHQLADGGGDERGEVAEPAVPGESMNLNRG